MDGENSYNVLSERIASLKELHAEKIERIKDNMKSDAVALVLQAAKTDDKLEGLNNEYKRIDKIVETRVSRELYDQYERNINNEIAELKEWKSKMNGYDLYVSSTTKEINELRDWKSTMNGKIAVFGGVIILAMSLIMWAFNYFK